jgi:hypothetical protein
MGANSTEFPEKSAAPLELTTESRKRDYLDVVIASTAFGRFGELIYAFGSARAGVSLRIESPSWARIRGSPVQIATENG